MAGQGDWDTAKVSSPTHELEAAGERVRVATCAAVAVFADGWMYRCRAVHSTPDAMGELHSWQCGWMSENAFDNPLRLPCQLPKGHAEGHATMVPSTVRWYNSNAGLTYDFSVGESMRVVPVGYDTEEAKRAATHVAEVLKAYNEALHPIFSDAQSEILVLEYARQMVASLAHPLIVKTPPPYQPIKKGEWTR